MRHDEHDEHDDTNAVLETLNDPLLTILGVLLMASLWLILPRESGSAVPDDGPYLQLTHTSDSLAQQIDAEAREAAALKDRLANLEKDVADALILQEQKETVRRDKMDTREDLLNQLAQIREETAALQTEVDQSIEEELEIDFGHPLSKATSKSPAFFDVHGEYVAPVTDEYFSSFRVGGTTTRTRVKEGIHYTKLGDSFGAFIKSLRDLRPDTDCVFFCVRESGFDTYRIARQVAREAGLQTGWEPFESQAGSDVLRFGNFGSNGVAITVNP